MTEEKLKTLKDLPSLAMGNPLSEVKEEIFIDIKDIKKGAIKQIIDGLKKKKNFFKVFLEFHNITEEDLK